jgi:hypothetical protein
MKTRSTLAAAALATLAFAGVACAKEDGDADLTATAVTNNDETTTAPTTGAPPETTTTTEADDGVLAIGEAFTWEDGLTVIVTGIEARPIDAGYEMISDGAVVTVQIQNGTGAAFDASSMSYGTNLSFGAAGAQAESAYVSNEGLTGFEGPVAPGATATASMGFRGVSDPSVLSVAIEPGFNYEAAFWSTAP